MWLDFYIIIYTGGQGRKRWSTKPPTVCVLVHGIVV